MHREDSVTENLGLEVWLETAVSGRPDLRPVSMAILALAEAGRKISKILARGLLEGALSEIIGDSRDGDGQKALDAMTHDIIRTALAATPVAALASEEADEPELLDPRGAIAVAIDPLDGSSNIETLAPVGTIFSILPMVPSRAGVAPVAPFLQTGRKQLAAGFIIYGPQTALVLTLGDGTRIFALDPKSGEYISTRGNLTVPATTREYAINSSNMRHWDPEIRTYVVDLMMGSDGPRGEDFNTRWVASMVADAYRILIRGGIYLYPGDMRRGYAKGRLRLIYEANPVAMLMEQAGGAATDGKTPILDLVPGDIHQRCPLVFGSSTEVRRVGANFESGTPLKSPLFGSRSLFRKTARGVESLP